MLVLLVIAAASAVCGELMHFHYVGRFPHFHFESHRCLWQPLVHFMLVAAATTCGSSLFCLLWWLFWQHRLNGWYCIIH